MPSFCPGCWDDKNQHPRPSPNKKDLLPGRNVEPVVFTQERLASREECGTGCVLQQFCCAGTTPTRQKMPFREGVARSQQMTAFIFTSTRSVYRVEKEWLCQYRWQKNCCGDQLLSQEMGMGAQHFLKCILTLNFSFGCHHLILLLCPGFCSF